MNPQNLVEIKFMKIEATEEKAEQIRAKLFKMGVQYSERKQDNKVVLELQEPVSDLSIVMKDMCIEGKMVVHEPDVVELLRKHVYGIGNDGTKVIVYEYPGFNRFTIYTKDIGREMDVRICKGQYGFMVLDNDVREFLEELDKLDRIFTIRVSRRLYEKLRNTDTNKIREALEKLFMNTGYTIVWSGEIKSLENTIEEYKKKVDELNKKMEKMKLAIEFIEDKGLVEEFREWLEQKLVKEEIEQKISEIVSELGLDLDPDPDLDVIT